MVRRTFICRLLILTLALESASRLLPRYARGEIPGADNAKAYTDAIYGEESLTFNRATMGEAYKIAGKRDAKWDAAALAYLEDMAMSFSYEGMPLRPKTVPSLKQLRDQGDALIAKGCDDPLVIYCHAINLSDARHTTDASKEFRRAFEGMKQSQYPPLRILMSAVHVLQRSSSLTPKELTSIAQITYANRLKVARGIATNRSERRRRLHTILDSLSDRTVQAEFYRDLQTYKDADPWIVKTVGGIYEIGLAWDVRGGGLAPTVTQDGWRGFAQHLAEARKLLTAAWQMEPGLPEPAEHMITVAMGDERPGPENTRTWFDRAVAAKFDHAPAYKALLWSMRPRWGGSFEKMLAFGIEASQTGRYDTLVPSYLMVVLEDIANDNLPQGTPLWTKPEVYAMLANVFKGYDQNLKDGEGREWMASWHAAFAARAGKMAEARELLDKLGDNVVVERFARTQQPSVLALSEVYALSGNHSDQTREAVRLLSNGQLIEARKIFEQLSAAAEADDKAAVYYSEMLLQLDRAKFATGEWVDLQPKKTLLGWTRRYGSWGVATTGRLIGTSSDRGLLLICDSDFGRRYEVRANLEITVPASVPKTSDAIGFALDSSDAGHRTSFYMSMKSQIVRGYSGQNRVSQNVPLQKINDVSIKMWDDHYFVTLNGKPVELIVGDAAQPKRLEPETHLAILSASKVAGIRVAISGLQIRRLSEEPATK